MKTPRIRTAAAVTAAVLCSGAFAGCSITKDEPADEPTSSGASTSASPDTSASPSPSESASPSPSVTASPTPSTEPSPSTPTAPPATTIEGALLTATEMPRLNPTSAWTQRRSGQIGTSSFGLCQKFDLLSIGAVSGVERTFATRGGSAGQQVAEFPDAQNTVRAGKVIEAWQRDCASRVRGTAVKVRPITDVPVNRGKGWWYLVSYERNGEGHFDSLGVVVSDARMTLIRMDHEGQDHNYPTGKDPMELAVKAASVKLG